MRYHGAEASRENGYAYSYIYINQDKLYPEVVKMDLVLDESFRPVDTDYKRV